MDRKKILQISRISAIIIAFALLAGATLTFLSKFVNKSDESTIRTMSSAEMSHKVLYIGSYTPQYFTYEYQKEGLEKILYPRGIEFDTFFMDSNQYSTVRDKNDFREFIQSRLTGRSDYEVIIASDDVALEFVLDNQEELFPNIPVVFFGVNSLPLAQRAAQNPLITGFFEDSHLAETIEVALRLFPERKTLVALHDRSAAGQMDFEGVKEAVQERGDLKLVDLDTTQIGRKELVDKLQGLGDDAIVLFMTCYTGADGENYSVVSRANTVLKHTNAPVFRNYVGAEGLGIIGGVSLDMLSYSEEVALAVADIIAGVDVSLMPLVTESPKVSTFDYAQLEKYGLDISLLPEGSVFTNRPESFLERYGTLMPVAVLIVLSLVMILVAVQLSVGIMRITNSELKASRDRLAESEEFMRYQTEHDEMLDILNRRTALDYLHNNI